jgi:2-methylcitrate dehydratase PrpD
VSHETRTLAEFIAATRFDDLPEGVVHEAQRHILDTLGATICGSTSESAEATRRATARLDGAGACTVIGRRAHANPFNASLINGTAAYSTLMDDFYSSRGLVHPGNHVIPVALSMGEHLSSSGAALITAVVVGYEVSCRVADAVGDSQDEMGFYQGSTNPHFGSAATAASLLNLDGQRVSFALGLAGAQASGLKEPGLVMNISQAFHAGRAASSGVLSGILAAEGLCAGDTVLEGANGYLSVFSRDADAKQLVEGLGTTFRIGHAGFKLYPAAAPIAASIDAAITLQGQHHLVPSMIEAVSVQTHRMSLRAHNRPEAFERLEALRSTQYCVARSLIYGRLSPSDFDPEHLSDPGVRALMPRIQMTIDPEMDRIAPQRYGSRVVVRTTDGRALEALVECPHGTPGAPLEDDEIMTKFGDLAEPLLGRRRVEMIMREVWSLDSAAGLDELMGHLVY